MGILPFLPISPEVKPYLQPAAVYSFVVGFVVYVILTKAGLQAKAEDFPAVGKERVDAKL